MWEFNVNIELIITNSKICYTQLIENEIKTSSRYVKQN